MWFTPKTNPNTMTTTNPTDWEKHFADKFGQFFAFDSAEYTEVLDFIRKELSLAKEAGVREGREEIVGIAEGMKGLINNPEFFIKVANKLKNNASDPNSQQITQVAWEAKDTTLDDLITKIQASRDNT